jgi:hypothetical protein
LFECKSSAKKRNNKIVCQMNGFDVWLKVLIIGSKNG